VTTRCLEELWNVNLREEVLDDPKYDGWIDDLAGGGIPEIESHGRKLCGEPRLASGCSANDDCGDSSRYICTEVPEKDDLRFSRR
jgi:hypothetical protein